jgi:hypothetical protein
MSAKVDHLVGGGCTPSTAGSTDAALAQQAIAFARAAAALQDGTVAMLAVAGPHPR